MPGLPEPKIGGGLVRAMRRLSISSCVFGVAFLVLAIVLTKLVSPDRFPVRVGGNIVRVKDLEAESQRLKEKKEELEHTRAGFTIETRAPVLSLVTTLAKTFPNVGEGLLEIEETRRGFTSGRSDPIALPEVEFFGIESRIVLRGEVTDADGRSVQILASFVDQLRGLSIFEDVSEPEYIARPLPGGGTSVPFTITLFLKDV